MFLNITLHTMYVEHTQNVHFFRATVHVQISYNN